MPSPGHVSKVWSLYKRILLLHRFLPIHLRALGDQYVKEEFRRHKTVSLREGTAFVAEWESYKDTLQNQVLDSSGRLAPRGNVGTALPEAKLKDFQDEQIGQLYELMLESTKANPQFDIQEDTK